MEHLNVLIMELIHAVESQKILLAHTMSTEIKEEIEKILKEKLKRGKDG